MTRITKDSGQRITISPGAKGALSEHLATAWLLRHGYDVFRNVAPNGRADLIAIDWSTNETLRVDVKSKGFTLTGTSPRARAAREMIEANDGFDIRYLVVQDDGSCAWFDKAADAANDNAFAAVEWWHDKTTGQRFKVPGTEMSRREWTFFCYWVLKNKKECIAPFDVGFVETIQSRSAGHGEIFIATEEFVVLEKLRLHIFEQIAAPSTERIAT